MSSLDFTLQNIDAVLPRGAWVAPTIDPARTLLLVLDVQNLIVNETGAAYVKSVGGAPEGKDVIEPIQRVLLSNGIDLDAAVTAIADPAAQPEGARLIDRPVTEEDALDMTFDADAACDHDPDPSKGCGPSSPPQYYPICLW